MRPASSGSGPSTAARTCGREGTLLSATTHTVTPIPRASPSVWCPRCWKTTGAASGSARREAGSRVRTAVRHVPALPGSGRPSTHDGVVLAQDRRGRIWAGTYRDGLAEFDPARGTFTVHDPPPRRPARVRGGQHLGHRGGPGWNARLGTNTGLVQFDPERRRAVVHHETPTPGGLSYTGVRALLHDREGNLWVGRPRRTQRAPPRQGCGALPPRGPGPREPEPRRRACPARGRPGPDLGGHHGGRGECPGPGLGQIQGLLSGTPKPRGLSHGRRRGPPALAEHEPGPVAARTRRVDGSRTSTSRAVSRLSSSRSARACGRGPGV